MVLLLPDALHQLTGLEPETLTNRFVDAQAVLPPDWHPMLAAVQSQPDSARLIETNINILLIVFMVDRNNAFRLV